MTSVWSKAPADDGGMQDQGFQISPVAVFCMASGPKRLAMPILVALMFGRHAAPELPKLTRIAAAQGLPKNLIWRSWKELG